MLCKNVIKLQIADILIVFENVTELQSANDVQRCIVASFKVDKVR